MALFSYLVFLYTDGHQFHEIHHNKCNEKGVKRFNPIPGVGKFTYPSGFLLISAKLSKSQACNFMTFNFNLFYTFSENFSPIGSIVPEL